MDQRLPPLPPKPDVESKPKASPLWFLLTGFGGLGLLIVLAFLVTPLLWVGVAIAGIIGLQYLLWGWLFERIYRSQPPEDESPIQAETADKPRPPWAV
jgi:hypothetical protein